MLMKIAHLIKGCVHGSGKHIFNSHAAFDLMNRCARITLAVDSA